MKKITIHLLFFLSFINVALYGQTPAEQQADIAALYTRLYAEAISPSVNTSNIANYLNKIDVATGRFTDVNYVYNSTSNDICIAYSPSKHTERMLEMTVAYCKSGTIYYHDAALLTKLKILLQDNYLNRSHTTIFAWTPNWFDTYIACPDRYGKCLILLRDVLTASELAPHVSYLRDVINTKNSGGAFQFIEGGANTVWVAQASIKKGVLAKDYSIIKNAFSFITGCLAYMYVDRVHNDGEGIKVDYSYHMHGSQLYMAGYGLGFIQDVLKNLKLADGTTLKTAFPAVGMDLFSKLLLEGHQYFVFHKNYDWNTAGRQVSSPTLSNIELPSSILTDAAIVFPAKATEYTNFANYVANPNQQLLNNIGSKYFFKSATLASTGTNYHLNVKMVSSRVEGTECMTSAGLKNKNIALGSTPIMTKGTEYANIYPTWDWNRIPGTTAELNNLPAYNASTYWVQATKNSFCGGLSQGSTGIGAFSIKAAENDPESGILYRKAYFMFDGALVCIGNGISGSKTNNIITSVNQCFSANNAVIYDGSEKTINTNQTTTYNNTLQWAFHENVGYVFPKSGNIVLKNDNQSGAWKDINLTYGSNIITNKVFSLWFDHGKTPTDDTYEYVVMPGTTLANVKSYIENPIFETVANDATVQAVKSDSKHLYGAVFSKAGSVQFSSNFIISVDKAAIVLITGESPNYTITVSDPLYVNYNTIKLTINNQVLTGRNASMVGANTLISCNMPTGYYAGSSFQNVYAGNMNLPNTITTIKTQKPQAVVFPNPSIGQYSIKSELIIKDIELYNVQGQKVFETNSLYSKNANIDLSSFSVAGLYIVQLNYSDKTQERISIIKQ